jgi:hypothetical protein
VFDNRAIVPDSDFYAGKLQVFDGIFSAQIADKIEFAFHL